MEMGQLWTLLLLLATAMQASALLLMILGVPYCRRRGRMRPRRGCGSGGIEEDCSQFIPVGGPPAYTARKFVRSGFTCGATGRTSVSTRMYEASQPSDDVMAEVADVTVNIEEEEEQQQQAEETPSTLPPPRALALEDDYQCDEPGCDRGRIMGGLGAIPLFGWWPIKAYRPCPKCAMAGRTYVRKGQALDEVVFREKPDGGYYEKEGVDEDAWGFDDTLFVAGKDLLDKNNPFRAQKEEEE